MYKRSDRVLRTGTEDVDQAEAKETLESLSVMTAIHQIWSLDFMPAAIGYWLLAIGAVSLVAIVGRFSL